MAKCEMENISKMNKEWINTKRREVTGEALTKQWGIAGAGKDEDFSVMEMRM